MNSIGGKIRWLRKVAGLSQAQLAEKVGSTAKTIQRYESGSTPDTHTLMELASFFGVSTDYLLEPDASPLRREDRERSPWHSHFEHYLRRKREFEIEEDAAYYWIYINHDGSFGGQSSWAGWADESKGLEIRRLRPVNPQAAIAWCTDTAEPPMFIYSEADVKVFCMFGGHAIIRADICEKYLPEFCEDCVTPNPERKIIEALCGQS